MSAVQRVLSDPLPRTAARSLRTQPKSAEASGGACAPWLIARGQSLAVPRLEKVPLHQSSFGSDAAAAQFACSLIELGIARPTDWIRAAGQPTRFLQRTFERFIAERGEAKIDGAFDLSITLSTDPNEWCEPEDEPDGSQMFLYVEAHSCGFVNLGPALAACEAAHPRLPATFARLFLDSVGRCFRVYDERDASDHISFLEESYDPVEDTEALAALPDRESIVPDCLKAGPLGPRKIRSLLARMAKGAPVVRLLRAAVELNRIANGVHLPPMPEPVRDLFSDYNPPVPVLLAIYRAGDAIEACFDEERQSMLELTPEPWPLIAFNGTDPESTRSAFDCLAGLLHVLAAARRVLDLVPGWKPIDGMERRG